MIIYIVSVVAFFCGFLTCSILTDSKVADLEAFGEECGEIILKQKDTIDKLKFDMEG